MLTDAAIAAAQPRDRPYKLSDQGGLFVFVTTKGAKSLRLKYRHQRKEKQLVFGLHPFISLADARRLAAEAKLAIKEQRDPARAPRTYSLVTMPLWEELPLPTDGSKVYFLQASTGHIKVGVARNVPARLSKLQIGQPQPLKVLGVLTGSYAHEKYIHNLFYETRLRGEWFEPSQRMTDFIADHCQC